MKTKIFVILLVTLLLISGCGLTSFTTKEIKKMSRDEAETKALQFLYDHTKNKEVYDQELTIKNYVFDSWKEDTIWHVIIYVGHTFIEVLVYDDGTNNIKVLAKTDYWKRVPKDVKNKINEEAGKTIV